MYVVCPMVLNIMGKRQMLGGRIRSSRGGTIAVLNRVTREGLTEKVNLSRDQK